MKVSVIIPCFNYSQFLHQAILSVVMQKVDFDMEIIISDDNSSDFSCETANIMAYFHESEKIKFKIYKQESNIGEINNTKFLIEKSEGEYIAYLDADDYWIDPYKLQKQISFLDENRDYSLCVAGFVEFNDRFYPTVDFNNWYCPPSFDLNSESLISGNSISCSSSRVFRNYKVENLFKDYFYEFPYSDWVLNFELSLLGKIEYLNFLSYVYRVHDNSLSRTDISLSDQLKLYDKRVSILKEEYKKRTSII